MLTSSDMSTDSHVLTSQLTSIQNNRGRNRIRVCKRCRFSTTDPKEFLHHQLNAHNENVEQHPCDKCNFITPSYVELLKHKRTHPDRNSNKRMSTDSDPGTPGQWEMADDKSEKSDMSDGMPHITEGSDDDMVPRSGVTLPTRTYTCADCGMSTTSPRIHLRHLVEDHGHDYQIYECDLCEYATRYKQKLPRHRKCHFMSPVSSPRVMSPPTELPTIPISKKPKLTGSINETENLNNGTDHEDEGKRRETNVKERGQEEIDLRADEELDEDDDQALIIHEESMDEEDSHRDINENVKEDYLRDESKTDKDFSSTDSFNNLRERLNHNFLAFGKRDLLSPPAKLQSDMESNLVIDTDKMSGSVSFTADKPLDTLQQKQEPIKPKKGTAPFREAVDPAKYIRIQDVDGIKYACSKCGNIYKWRKSLNKHWKEKHDGEIPTPITAGGFTMLNVPQVRSGQSGLSGLSMAKSSMDKSLNKSPLDRSPGFTSTLGRNSFSTTSPIKFDAKSLKMPAYSEAFNKSMWSRAEKFSRSSPIMVQSTPSPTVSMHRSRSDSQVSLSGAVYNRPRDLTPRSDNKPSGMKSGHFSSTVFGLPPAAHSRGFKHTEEPCDEAPLDLSMPSKSKSRSSDAMDLTGKKDTKEKTLSAKSYEQPLDFSSSSKPSGRMLPGLPGVVVKEEVDGYQEIQVRGTGLPIFSSQDTWQCYKCTYIASNGKDYERHLQEHANKHTCYECKENFAAVDDLNSHFANSHMDVIHKKLFETQSPDATPEKTQLYKYLTMPKEMNTLNCVICGSKFTWAWDLEKHFDQNHSSLPNPYENMEEKQQSELSGKDSVSLACTQCTFVAKDNMELSRHQLIHSFNRPYACTKCGYSTKWSKDLDQHMARYHSASSQSQSPSPTKADDSDNSNDSFENTYEKNTYFSHLGLRSNDGDSQSPTDSKKNHTSMFGISINLSSSRESLTPKSMDSAPQTGSGGKSRNRKPGGSTSAEILLPYKCSVCEYRARWPSEITQHMKNHSDEKPFHCPRCTYKSKWKWDVVKHLKRCGGGTVRDVIDTTKQQKKSSSPPWVKALQFKAGNNPGQQSPNSSSLSGGPPNVTVVPASQTASQDSPSQVVMKSSVDESKLIPYSRAGESDSPKSNKTTVFRGIINQGQYHCLQCPFVGNSPAELKRHTRVHSDEKPFGCLTCGYCSKWKCDLKKHLRTYDHQPAPLPGEAGYNYDSEDEEEMMESYGKYESDSASQVPALYRCEKCQYATFKKESLDAHTCMQSYTQSGDKSNKLKCKQCDYEAQDLSAFLQHKLSHTSDRAGSPVSREGSTERDITRPPSPPRHRRKPQKSNIQHRCPKCPYTCFSKVDMLAHQARHGSKLAGTQVCQYCDFHSDDHQELDQHSKLHPEHYQASNMEEEEEEEAVPEEDREDVAQKLNLKKRDGDCSPYDLSQALKAARSPGTSGYQCDKCPYFTSHRSNYEKHYRMHGANNKYRCEWCDWSIDRLNLLFRHAKCVHPVEFHQKERDNAIDSPGAGLSGGSELEDGDKENTDIEEDGRAFEKENLKRPNEGDKSEEPVSKKLKENETEQHFLGLSQTNFDGGGSENDDTEEEEAMDAEEANNNQSNQSPKNWYVPDPLTLAVDLSAANLAASALAVPPGRENSSPNERGSGRKLHKCPKCPYKVKCRDALQHHINLHGAGHPFKCDYCDYSVHRSNLLIQHTRVHTPEAAMATNQPGRNEVSLAAGNKVKPLLKLKLANIVKTPNSVKKKTSPNKSATSPSKFSIRTRYKCSRCPYVSFCKSNLIKHKKLHLMQSKYRCSYCTYSANRWTLLNQHVKFHEGAAEELTANTGKMEKFNDVYLDGEDQNGSGQLNDSQEEMTTEDTSGTEDCDLKQNIKQTTANGDKDISSPICSPMNSPLGSPINSPLGSPNPGKKKRSHICDTCPFRSSSLFEYQKHAKLHGADLKFRCDYCNYSLARLNLMYQHRKLHSEAPGFLPDPVHEQVLNKSWSGFVPSKEDAKEGKNALKSAETGNNANGMKDKYEDGDFSLDEGVAFCQLQDDDKDVPGSPDVMRFGCKHCPYKCNSPQHYRLHAQMHGAAKQYICDFCDWSTNRINLMFHHRKVHAAESGFDAECEITKLLNQFLDKVELSQQQNEKKAKSETDVAEDIAKASDIKSDSVKKTGRAKLYNCDACPFKCDKRQSYSSHVRLHDGSKRYTCEVCNYSVDRINLLYQHSKLHVGNDANVKDNKNKTDDSNSPAKKRFRCSKCPYHTHSHILLDLHNKMHASGKKYICQFCDYSIDKFSSLQHHMTIHITKKPSGAVTMSSESEGKKCTERAATPEKKSFYYKCDRCPYQTNNRGNFENHKNQHVTRSKLGCPYCDYSSPRSAQLASHIRIHFPGSHLDIQTIRALIAGANQEQDINPATPISENTESEGERSRESTPGVTTSSRESAPGGNVGTRESSPGVLPAEMPKIGSETISAHQTASLCKYCDREFGDLASKDQHERQHLIGVHSVS